MANADTPPPWSPEMWHDPVYPYTLSEYKFDVGRWAAATEVAEERKAILIAMALEGFARIVSDDLGTSVLQHGGDLDLHDGKGVRRFSGVQL